MNTNTNKLNELRKLLAKIEKQAAETNHRINDARTGLKLSMATIGK